MRRPCCGAPAIPAMAGALLLLLAFVPRASSAQTPPPAPAGEIAGVVRSAAGRPVGGAAVLVVELHRTVPTGGDGAFSVAAVPPGRYTLQVFSDRDGVAVAEVDVAAGETRRVEVTLGLAEHQEEIVVSAGAEPRSALEVAQPVGVLTGEELGRRAQASLGETLAEQPGVTSTYFGPGASRPVIRGLGGDRVRMLESGLGTGDVSSTSPDHAVASEPLSAESIEVVRGPATLLYGSSAIGGAVNVLDRRIPERRAAGLGAFFDLRGGTVADELALAAAVDGGAGSWAWHAEGVARQTDDYEIPGFAESAALRAEEGHEEGEEAFGVLPNSDLETTSGSFGLSRFFGESGHFGVSVSGLESEYGVPGGHVAHGGEGEQEEHDEGEEEGEVPIRIDLRQKRLDLAGHWHHDFGPFEGIQARAGLVEYEHVELEGEEVGTRFGQDSWEARLDLVQRERGDLSGAAGVQVHSRDLDLEGEEAFLPSSSSDGFAAFLFEELRRGDLRWQLGLRWESLDVAAAGRPDRSFDGLSSSLALVWLPEGGAWSIGSSLARSVKLPNVEELYSDGLHAAIRSFQRGNVDLGEETSLGLDVSLRKVAGRATGSLTVFANRFDDFIFERATGEVEEGLPVLEFAQADARFNGAEAEARIGLVEADEDGGGHLDLELTGDWVRAELRDPDQPLPRIPPWRAGAGLHWAGGPWTAMAEVRHTAEQDRVAPMETPTGDYTLINASVGYRLLLREQVLDLTLIGRNLGDEEARNHTSYLKDFAPLPGREVMVSARLTF